MDPLARYEARPRSYDARGNVVTTHSSAAVTALDRATHGLLSHRADVAQALDLALEHDPALALAHALRGFGLRLLARSDSLCEAELALSEARYALRTREHSPRERLLVAALGAFCSHDSELTIDLLERALELAPSCLMAMKLHHAVCFMHGEVKRMRDALERTLPRMDSRAQDHHFALGCYAFALEESAEYEDAERYARYALARAPYDVWSYHAFLHVLTMQDRTREGLTFARASSYRSPTVNNFGAHVAWHHALFAIAERELDEALALYDAETATALACDYRDLANCASLLFRLECAGREVGDRWERLAGWSEARSDDAILPFADVHQLLALGRAGRVDALRARLLGMRAAALARRGKSAKTIRELGIPIGEGLLALAQGAHVTAMARLVKSSDETSPLGGSAAQRELFELLALEATARARDFEIGAKLAARKLAQRPRCGWALRFAAEFSDQALAVRERSAT